MTVRQKGGATLVSALAVVLTAWLSQLPMTHKEADEALVRLSWRLEGFAVEECRTLGEDELAEIPAHMRRSEECTRTIVDYELRVDIGSGPELVDTVAPSGARRDRPVYVFRDIPVASGSHDVEITFTALVSDRLPESERPAPLQWRDTIVLEANDIGLVTLDESGTRLARVTPNR